MKSSWSGPPSQLRRSWVVSWLVFSRVYIILATFLLYPTHIYNINIIHHNTYYMYIIYNYIYIYNIYIHIYVYTIHTTSTCHDLQTSDVDSHTSPLLGITKTAHRTCWDPPTWCVLIKTCRFMSPEIHPGLTVIYCHPWVTSAELCG